METILKLSVLLMLSLNWTTKTRCYKPCFRLPPRVVQKSAPEAREEPKEMDGFWLTQFLMVEG